MDVNREIFLPLFLSRQAIGARPLIRNASYAIHSSKMLRLISKLITHVETGLDPSRYPFAEEMLYNLAWQFTIDISYDRRFRSISKRSRTHARVAYITLNMLLCDVLYTQIWQCTYICVDGCSTLHKRARARVSAI